MKLHKAPLKIVTGLPSEKIPSRSTFGARTGLQIAILLTWPTMLGPPTTNSSFLLQLAVFQPINMVFSIFPAMFGNGAKTLSPVHPIKKLCGAPLGNNTNSKIFCWAIAPRPNPLPLIATISVFALSCGKRLNNRTQYSVLVKKSIHPHNVLVVLNVA